jgi:hypothetical protein
MTLKMLVFCIRYCVYPRFLDSSFRWNHNGVS